MHLNAIFVKLLLLSLAEENLNHSKVLNERSLPKRGTVPEMAKCNEAGEHETNGIWSFYSLLGTSRILDLVCSYSLPSRNLQCEMDLSVYFLASSNSFGNTC